MGIFPKDRGENSKNIGVATTQISTAQVKIPRYLENPKCSVPVFACTDAGCALKHTRHTGASGVTIFKNLDLETLVGKNDKNIPQMVVSLMVIYHGRIRKKSSTKQTKEKDHRIIVCSPRRNSGKKKKKHPRRIACACVPWSRLSLYWG